MISIKKTAKRLFAAIAALVMALAVVTPAFAATITINGNEGETYKAYKVLDVTTVEDESGEVIGYSYTTDNEDLVTYLRNAGFTVTNNGGLNYVTAPDDDAETADVDEWQACADNLTAALAALSDTELENLLGTAAGAATLEGETGTINKLDAGYYFVTSSLGSLCMLNTAADTANVYEKNQEPTVEKTVSSTDAQIGDTVTYTVTIDVPANTETLKLNDTLSDGLTLDEDSFTVSIDTLDPLPPLVDPTVTYKEDGTTSFVLDLTSYVAEMSADATITITYTATVNENAIHTNPATNEAYVDYGNSSSSVSSETSTYTHAIYLNKVDDNGNPLNGAEFQLTDEDNAPVYVVPVYGEGDESETIVYYRAATADEIVNAATSGATTTIVVDGSTVIEGLKDGTYYLTETKAPDGYNIAEGYFTALIRPGGSDGAGNTVTVTVQNSAGSLLPSTGGMGTTILYAVGAVLVIGAGVTLVVRRRAGVNA